MTDTDRLRLLEDREQIRQIFVDYAKYLDSGDHAGYASLFADDGVLAGPTRRGRRSCGDRGGPRRDPRPARPRPPPGRRST